MAKAKYAYSMDYIKDKDVFKAVMFARKMRRDGRTAEKERKKGDGKGEKDND